MNRILAMIVVVAASLFVSSCVPQQPDMAALKKTVDEYNAASKDAMMNGNSDKVMSYYEDNAMEMAPNMPMMKGKEAIKARIADRLAKDTSGNYNVYKIVDLFAEGNMTVEIGSWSILNPSGTEVDKGHYLSYFQKRDGKYVCVRDISVSSMPAKP